MIWYQISNIKKIGYRDVAIKSRCVLLLQLWRRISPATTHCQYIVCRKFSRCCREERRRWTATCQTLNFNRLTAKMLMHFTSNIIKTAGQSMLQKCFVNHLPQASEVTAKIEFVAMTKMALKSGKVMNMSELQAAFDANSQVLDNWLKGKTCSHDLRQT